MAFLKSIILFVFFIHWVKAVQITNDVDAEFNKIFHQIRHSIDNAWRWMMEATKKSYFRINEIFMTRKPMEQGRYKYQDVVAPNKLDEGKIQSQNVPSPLMLNQGAEKLIPVVPSAAPELPAKSENLQKATPIKPENDTTKVTEPPMEQTETECEELPTQETTTVGGVESETQTESQIPLQGDQDVNKVELPTVQDIEVGDSPAVEEVPETDDEIEITKPIVDKEKEPEVIRADPSEHIEFEMKTGLSRSIYHQQNIIILFLFFLIVIMSAYFFLLSRTSHVCPTIMIGELGGNLKPTMHNIKK